MRYSEHAYADMKKGDRIELKNFNNLIYMLLY